LYHPKLVEFQNRLKALMDEVDHYIEDQYGHLYPLHPARPKRGKTSNPQADGLFNLGADFTPGFGSRFGRGYIVDLRMVTLEEVDEDYKWEIIEQVVVKLRELLPQYFPERNLEIFAEGSHFKIIGDFSLGEV